MPSLTAALVGFGAIARHGHLPWYLRPSAATLTAVVEPEAGGRAAARALLPHVELFESLQELLRRQRPTFVDITAPPAAHRDLILEAMAAGVHVICEKPFVTSKPALVEIERRRRDDGLLVAACHNWRYAPAIRRCLELVADGCIGEPATFGFVAERRLPASGAAHWKPDWRLSSKDGGGIIADLGYHGIYLAARIFGRPPLRVESRATRRGRASETAESDAEVELDFGNGARADLTLSWHAASRRTALRISGSNGDLIVDGDSLQVHAPGRPPTVERFGQLADDSWHAAWIAETLDWFVEAVQHGDRDAAWQDIEWTVAALDAAYRCSSGRPREDEPRVEPRQANAPGSSGTPPDIPRVVRASSFPQYAYGVLQAASLAKRLQLPSITVAELGVAGGNGLVELERLSGAIGVDERIDVAVVGFDLGSGMPEPLDFRDMPYIWQRGFFRMDETLLRSRLTSARLILGDVAETGAAFMATKPAPIGFISFDLDYYSSTVSAMRSLLEEPAGRYLPRVFCYFDDTVGPHEELHSEYTGELLAIREFNAAHEHRKLAKIHGLRYKLLPLEEPWIDAMYVLHIFDHPRYNDYVYTEPDRQFPLEDRP